MFCLAVLFVRRVLQAAQPESTLVLWEYQEREQCCHERAKESSGLQSLVSREIQLSGLQGTGYYEQDIVTVVESHFFGLKCCYF